MSTARYIGRTALRRVIWILVGLSVYAVLSFFGVARAASVCGIPDRPTALAAAGFSTSYATSGEALQACYSVAPVIYDGFDSNYARTFASLTCVLETASNAHSVRVTWQGTLKKIEQSTCVEASTFAGSVSSVGWPWSVQGCPAGTTWDEGSHTCFDPAQCLAKEPLSSAWTNQIAISNGICNAGCQFIPATQQMSISVPGTSNFITNGTGWIPSGSACGTSPAPDSTDPQFCVPAGSGQTMCIQNDGQHCYSTPINGRRICWRPGQTGEKNDATSRQVRAAGTDTPLPQNPAPPGETLVVTGTPTTVSTTINNPATSQSTTSTTTTSNYVTQNGTNAGGSAPDEGVNADGTGGGTPQNSGGDDQQGKGAASGGGSCASPPICSGDPVGCSVLAQQWNSRCETETFRDSSQADMTEGDAPPASGALWGSDTTSSEFDLSGFGLARSCPEPPTITLGGMTRTIDTSALCDLGGIIAAMVLLMALAHSVWIVGESVT